MALLNPNIILSGQQADILGAMHQGNALAQQVNQQRQQNALRGFLGDNAEALMQGDQNALAQYARLDPAAAFDMMGRQQDRAWREDERRYQRGRDARQDQRAAKMDARGDQEWQMKLDEYARGLSAQEREAQAKQVTDVLAGASHFYQSGDRAGYARWLQQNGLNPEDYSFDDFPAYAQRYGDVAKILRGGGEVGLQVFYGRDEEGNVVPLQAGKDGVAVQTQLPKGVSAIDLSVKAEETARGTARGRAKGEAEQALPGAYAEAEHVIGMVDDLINDPYLPNMLGPAKSRLPNVTPDAARVQSRMDQVVGQGFMAARQFLKGQGQITDFESRRAEAAIARMSAAQGYEDYVDALREFQDAVRVGILKAEAAAGKEQTGTPAPPGDDGWREFNGVRVRRRN